MDELPLGQFNNHRLVRTYAARLRYHPISYSVPEKPASPPSTNLADLSGLPRGFEVKQVRVRVSFKLEKRSCLKVRSNPRTMAESSCCLYQRAGSECRGTPKMHLMMAKLYRATGMTTSISHLKF